MDSSISISSKEVIHVDNLRKSYKGLVAVDGISFDISQGEIFGLLGPNGAGKTTAVECLQGLRHPTSGTRRVLGFDSPSKLISNFSTNFRTAFSHKGNDLSWLRDIYSH